MSVASPSCSVVLCTFDRAHLLLRAIRSVLAQDHDDWELVVVDDGSTDHTPAVVLDLARHDSRVVYVRQVNQGLAAARNRGLATARGEWIAILDSDDEYEPGHLSQRLAYVRAHPTLHGLHGGAVLLGPEDRQWVPDMDRPGELIHLSVCHIGGTLFARRAALLAVGGYRSLTFAEDSELFARLSARFPTATVDLPTYRYHLEGDDRLGALAAEGGDAAILDFRRRHAPDAVVDADRSSEALWEETRQAAAAGQPEQ